MFSFPRRAATGNTMCRSSAGWRPSKSSEARTLLGLATSDSPTFAGLGIGVTPGATLDVLAGTTGRMRYSTDGSNGSFIDYISADAATWNKLTARATQMSFLVASSGAPASGLVLTPGAATFSGNVSCAALTATAAAGNNARIAVNNAGPIGAGGYNGYEFYETGVLKAIQYWDPSAARVALNASFAVTGTAAPGTAGANEVRIGGGQINAAGGGTFGGQCTISSGGTDESLQLKATGSPYLAFYPSGGSTRKGYIQVNTSGNMAIVNEGGSPMFVSGASSAGSAQFDDSSTADDTRLLLWDVTAGSFKRVTRGAADSGGTGYRLLRIAN